MAELTAQELLNDVCTTWGEQSAHSAALRAVLAENDTLRALNVELVPFMLDDVRAGLELGPPPDGHSDNCDDCAWYARSLSWQQRTDAGEIVVSRE